MPSLKLEVAQMLYRCGSLSLRRLQEVEAEYGPCPTEVFPASRPQSINHQPSTINPTPTLSAPDGEQ